jgi:hypothetical protein
MLAEARDILATMFLEKQLGMLREELLARALEGRPADAEFQEKAERAIIEEFKRRFYNQEVRQLVKPWAKAGDEEDFEKRTQKLGEHATWMTHRKLVAIPFVGQPEQRGRP